jgi:serine protease Do
MKSFHRKAGRVALALPLVMLLLGGCGEDNAANAQSRGSLTQVREQLGPVPMSLDTATAARLSGAFRGAADRALPAVVQIRVTTRPETNTGNTRRFQLPFQIPGMPEGMDPSPRGGRGTGSGVIFDARGYILTNNHVVQNAATVRVVMVDGREYDGKVVGTDPNTDVAVIKIEPRRGEQLPFAQLGNSGDLRVGDWVLALGSPLGLEFTVTAGIVSAIGRQLNIIEPTSAGTSLEAFIQTDAAINPGNSGGPLVDLLGRVMGVNTAIQSPTGYFAGAGFAIPIDLARKVASDLIEFGVVHRPRLGVGVDPITEADAEAYKLPEVAGAEIVSVDPQMAAAKAGIKMGDVVIALDGEPIRTATSFMAKLAMKRPGDRVKLDIIRYGQPVSANVQLGEFEAPRAERPVASARPSAADLLGFRVQAWTPELASRVRGADVSEARGQIIVTDIDPYSPAFEGNVRNGLEIVSINGQKVNSAQDVERVASSVKSGDVITIVGKAPAPDAPPRIYNFRARR